MKSLYINSLIHTTLECKYHIMFALKFRRREIYGKLKQEIEMTLIELCRRKEVEIISIPLKLCISLFMGYLKEKNTLIIFDERHINLKYKYGNRAWCTGYLCKYSRR